MSREEIRYHKKVIIEKIRNSKTYEDILDALFYAEYFSPRLTSLAWKAAEKMLTV